MGETLLTIFLAPIIFLGGLVAAILLLALVAYLYDRLRHGLLYGRWRW
jgi:hypothetical protein